jgi:hypothetical protein
VVLVLLFLRGLLPLGEVAVLVLLLHVGLRSVATVSPDIVPRSR